MKTKSTNRKKVIIISLLTTVLLAGGALAYVKLRPSDTPTASTGKAATDAYNKIDYSPADDTDESYTENIKQNLPDGNASDTAPSTAKKNTSPTIVDASQYGDEVEIRSIVAGIVEDDGVCTIAITGPQNNKITKTVSGVADASSTRCENAVIPRAQFNTTGSWTVRVTYNSVQAAGTSASKVMVIK